MIQNKDIIERLEKLIYESGSTPAKLAIELSFNKSALSQLKKKGKVEYSSVFNKIVERIKADRDYVLTGKGSKYLVEHSKAIQVNEGSVELESISELRGMIKLLKDQLRECQERLLYFEKKYGDDKTHPKSKLSSG